MKADKLRMWIAAALRHEGGALGGGRQVARAQAAISDHHFGQRG